MKNKYMYLFIVISSIYMLSKVSKFLLDIFQLNDTNLDEYFQLKEYFEYGTNKINEIVDYENIALQGILLYNKGFTFITECLNDIYKNNEDIHITVDFFYNLYLSVYGNLNNVKVEPFGNYWFLLSTMYLDRNENTYKLVENYQHIHFNKNEDISNMVIHNMLKPYSKENSEDTSNIDIKNFYMLKYNNSYLCTHNKRRIFDSWNGLMETTSNPFFEVEYNDNKYQISIDIPKSYFIVGNEILSSIFLKRWFEYTVMPDDFIFTNDYTIKITDDDFNEIEIKNNEYILLNQNGYSIQKIK